MPAVTLNELASSLKMDVNDVRDILTEKPGINFDKNTLDNVFGTARKMGYDFKKLKVGKRMNQREETLLSLLEQVEGNPSWNRNEIIEYLQKSTSMIKRVHKRAFDEEFGKK